MIVSIATAIRSMMAENPPIHLRVVEAELTKKAVVMVATATVRKIPKKM